MQLYTGTIRLSGSLFNEVKKDDLTAPEITVLKRIHGGDAIHGIVANKHVDRDDAQERARLHNIYGRALARIKNVGTLDALLGPEGVPLAKSVPGVDSLPAPKTGRRASAPVVEMSPADPIEQTEFA